MIHSALDPLLLASLTDPTSDGIFVKAVNFLLAVLEIVAVGYFGWHVFKAWANDGKLQFAEIRGLTVGFLVVEGLIAGAAVLANYGSTLLSMVGFG